MEDNTNALLELVVYSLKKHSLWCNGDCIWKSGRCVRKTNETQVNCGGHSADKCANCHQVESYKKTKTKR